MEELNLPDLAARKSIAADLDVNMLVEAGAGSGKTHSLVERMVALVAAGKCPVYKMAAVTFTRKAAGELRERFQTTLERALAAESDPTRRERLADGLAGLDRCFLGTIHSFCAAVLRERPIEAGLDPDFGELEEMENRLFLEESWQEYLELVPAERLKALEDLDVDVNDLGDCYHLLTGYPEVVMAYEDLTPPELAPVREQVRDYLAAVEPLLPEQVPDGGWDELQKTLRRAVQFARTMDLSVDRHLVRLLGLCARNPRPVYKRWPDKKTAAAVQERHTLFCRQTVEPVLRAWQEYRYGLLLQFLLPAVNYSENYRLTRSRLNFQDLLVKTAALLRDQASVRRYFQNRYSHLLVDEFQDTDPLQAEIIFYLTGENVRERDWRRLVPRPGSLFVVGDPKQSIYRFRRADIDIYQEVKTLLEKSGGRVVRLTANFRSRPAVTAWVNAVFQKLLPAVDTPFQAAFAAMQPVQNDAGTVGVRKICLPAVYRHIQEDIAAADARLVALFIRGALDTGIALARTERERQAGLTEKPRPADFMILLRYKDHLFFYARELEKLGVPCTVSGAESPAGGEDLAEIVKVLRAVAEPDNPLALVGALRGTFFGISDRQLWQYKKAGGTFNFYFPVPPFPEASYFHQSFEQFKMFREWVDELPPLAALEKILESLGALPLTLTGEAGRSRCGRILHALELLRGSDGEGLSFTALVDWLAELMNAGGEEELNITPWETDVVRIMNLHRAKGLEAPVVILADPGKKVERAPEIHICRQGDVPQGYFLLTGGRRWKKKVLGRPRDWERYAGAEGRYQEAEETRLLYVAATRAKNLLVVSTYPAKPEKSPWHPFAAELAEAEEIAAPTAAPAVGDVPAAPADVPEEGEDGVEKELGAARGDMAVLLADLARPSYVRMAVSEAAGAAGKRPAGEPGGRGPAWGRAVHRVLQACAGEAEVDAPRLEAVAAAALLDEGLPPDAKNELLHLVREILASPLWRRIGRSREYYVEVPFALPREMIDAFDRSAAVDGGSHPAGLPAENSSALSGGADSVAAVGENGGGAAGLISGVIDLVFREEEGWVIVDYKTDAVSGGEHLDELVRFYAPQVDLYRRCWERLTGTPVHEAGLYFTGLQKWVTV